MKNWKSSPGYAFRKCKSEINWLEMLGKYKEQGDVRQICTNWGIFLNLSYKCYI